MEKGCYIDGNGNLVELTRSISPRSDGTVTRNRYDPGVGDRVLEKSDVDPFDKHYIPIWSKV